MREIWEGYFGRELPWHFQRRYPKLELIPRSLAENSYVGDGYLELGSVKGASEGLYSLNFDAVAHEIGHLIGWAVIGKPARRSLRYRANDEACADLIAIVSSLHFDTVVDRLLESTRGDLFSVNLLSRVGELSDTRYTRRAFNSARMSTVAPTGDPDTDKFRWAQPFTGAGFDILAGMYERGLVERRAIPAQLRRPFPPRRRSTPGLERGYARAFRTRRARFRSALLDARNEFGRLLARALEKTPMRRRSHATVAASMLAADRELTNGRYRDLVRACFEWRKIL